MDTKPKTTPVQQTYGSEKPSYYVYREGGRSPTKPHPNRFSATKEAKRLAEADPGATYHVLKVRATFVNTEPVAPLLTNFEKQMAAREGMEQGSIVQVIDSHHTHAGKLGYVAYFSKEDDDPSVYVTLTNHLFPARFSPTSLILKSKPAGTSRSTAQAEEARPSPKADSPTDETPFDFIGDLIAGIIHGAIVKKNIRDMKLGTEVMVVRDPGFLFIPATGYRAKLHELDEDPQFVWVEMLQTKSGNPDLVKVNIDRVRALDECEVID